MLKAKRLWLLTLPKVAGVVIAVLLNPDKPNKNQGYLVFDFTFRLH